MRYAIIDLGFLQAFLDGVIGPRSEATWKTLAEAWRDGEGLANAAIVSDDRRVVLWWGLQSHRSRLREVQA